jgi:hypothetical protein
MYTCYIYVCARTYYVEWLGLRANSAFKCNGWTRMKLEYIGIGIRCIRMYWNILYLCVDWHLDHMCAFGICIEMLLLGNFHGGLYSHEITYFRGGVLSRNLFHEGDSHEIYFRGWLPRNTKLSRNHFMTVTSHEIPQKAVMKTLMQIWWQCCFHEGDRHEPPQENNLWWWTLMKMVFSCVYYRWWWTLMKMVFLCVYYRES